MSSVWESGVPAPAAPAVLGAASQISYAPTLPLISTDVQAAIDELAAGVAIHGLAAKGSLANTDELILADSAAAFAHKKITGLTLKGIFAAIAGSATQVFSAAAATLAAHVPRADQIQNQSLTAFTTGGTGAAFTLTPVPALASYATGRPRGRMIFHANPGATPTINISGLGAKALKYKTVLGSKANVRSTVCPIGWVTDWEYDGTDVVVLEPKNRNVFAGLQSSNVFTLVGTAPGWNKVTFAATAHPAANTTDITLDTATTAFTINTAGQYRISAVIRGYAVSTVPEIIQHQFRFYKNGGALSQITHFSHPASLLNNSNTVFLMEIETLAVGDVIELYMNHTAPTDAAATSACNGIDFYVEAL